MESSLAVKVVGSSEEFSLLHHSEHRAVIISRERLEMERRWEQIGRGLKILSVVVLVCFGVRIMKYTLLVEK